MTRTSEQITGEWLVLQAQSGKRQALATLVRHWYPLLLRYASTCLGRGEDAADAVQETLLLACRRIGTVRDPAAFPGWIYRILHRRCMDQLRRFPSQPALKDQEAEVETVAEQADLALQQDMHEAMRRLPPASYRILHLYYLHDLGVGEIAAIQEIPAGTVKSRLHTARQQLKTLLRGYDDE